MASAKFVVPGGQRLKRGVGPYAFGHGVAFVYPLAIVGVRHQNLDMPPFNKVRYQIEKISRRATKTYPLASVIYYGPDSQRATKVVVGIFQGPGQEALAMEKLFATNDKDDLRYLHEIDEKILAIIQQHNVQSVSLLDRIFGCPHEEGIDYPTGESCPQCPYWANRDRYTGELLA